MLGLARRERATAEHIELVAFLRNFIEEFRQSVPDETDNISLAVSQPLVSALVDSRHLHQVLTAMVQNARRHGHMPGQPARITLHAYRLDDTPVIDVIDRGPGIPESVVPQLFRPFLHHVRARHRARPVHCPGAVPRQRRLAGPRAAPRWRLLLPDHDARPAFPVACLMPLAVARSRMGGCRVLPQMG